MQSLYLSTYMYLTNPCVQKIGTGYNNMYRYKYSPTASTLVLCKAGWRQPETHFVGKEIVRSLFNETIIFHTCPWFLTGVTTFLSLLWGNQHIMSRNNEVQPSIRITCTSHMHELMQMQQTVIDHIKYEDYWLQLQVTQNTDQCDVM